MVLRFVPAWLCLVSGLASAGDYVQDKEAACHVWAPNRLAAGDYVLRYRGDCRDGRAEGKGKAEWLHRWAENKLAYVWDGGFRNGVFLGDRPVEGPVEVMGNRDVLLLGLGRLATGRLAFVSTSADFAPVVLCNVDLVAAILDDKVESADDASVLAQLHEAGERYRTLCPDSRSHNVRINAYRAPLKPNQGGYLPEPIADVTFAPAKDGEAAFSHYRNKATEANQAKARVRAREGQRAEARRQFMEFSRKHGIQAWVTSRNLEKNPFVWQDKTVALAVRLERMLTQDLALVHGIGEGGWYGGDALLLQGVKPDFFGEGAAVLAARVGKRVSSRDLGDTGKYEYEATVLHYLAGQPCNKPRCAEWFDWEGADETIHWDKPFSPYP